MVDEAREEEEEAKRQKHTPSRRGHSKKSQPALKRRFQKKAARKRQQELDEIATQWEVWDALPDSVKTIRHDLEPKGPRPESKKAR